MRMQSKLKKCFKADRKLQELYAYRTWVRRSGIRYSKLGLSNAKCLKDRCPVCNTWDNCVSREVEREVCEVVTALEALDNKFFFRMDCARRQRVE